MTVADIEIPRVLPGDLRHLSVASIRTYLQSLYRWRLRYLDNMYEPTSGAAIIGAAAGAAEGASFHHVIQAGAPLATEAVLDLYSDEFDERAERDEVDWHAEKPGQAKDQGRDALAVYHERLAPQVRPVTVERRVELSFDGADWTFVGYLDVETAENRLLDVKVKARMLAQPDADSALQPAAYLAARRAEGHPADGFDYHIMRRGTHPDTGVVTTERTNVQLDAFLVRVATVAREIAWRAEYDVWQGAPEGAWWCSERWCGYWHSCPFGGGR